MREEVVTRCDIVYYSVRWNNLCFHTVSFRLNTKFIWLLECFYSLCLFSTKTYCTEHTDVYYNWLRMYTLTVCDCVCVCVCVCVCLCYFLQTLSLSLLSLHITEVESQSFSVSVKFSLSLKCFQLALSSFTLCSVWAHIETYSELKTC